MGAAILSFIVLACSGPGAMEFINSNVSKSMQLAKVAAVFVVLMWLAYWWRRGKFGLLLCICSSFSFAIHPAWMISAMIGDCGIAKLSYSTFFTSIIGATFILQLCWWLWKRKTDSTTNPV